MKRQRAVGLILGVRFNKIKRPFLALLFLIPLSACATLFRSPSRDSNSNLSVPAAPSNVRLQQGRKQSAKNSKETVEAQEAVKIQKVVEVQSGPLPTNSNGSPVGPETEPPKANNWQLELSNLYQKEFGEKTSNSQTNKNPTKTAGTSTSKDEWFIDFHIGPAWTNAEDVTVLGTNFGDVDFDSTVSFGGRFGYWLKSYPFFGVALDVSHYRPSLDGLDTAITEITADLMLRHGLMVDKTFPSGRVQPYLTFGTGLFIAAADFSVFSDTSTSAGIKVGPGLAWMLRPDVALFTEYRFSYLKPSFNIAGVDIDLGVKTHRWLFGVSYRF